jgi:DNA polymerase-3 subunit alpha
VSNMSFVHLHVHSCYSLLDGAIRIEDLVKTTKAMGMEAVALTDHGQMMGLWAFYQAATAQKIKPILGVETYVASRGRKNRDPNESRYHLTLLAQNLTGYRNLCRLISLANMEGFYFKPRVDKELLAQYSEGIIALSACLQGELPQEIVKGADLDTLKEVADSYSAIFPGRFYLEIMEIGLPQQTPVNEALIDLAKKASLPLVATNDCHYLLKEHHTAHEILLCVQTRKKLADSDRMRFPSEEFYFKSPEEMAQRFAYIPEAISNTVAIANSCEVEFPEKSFHFPSLKLPDSRTADELLVEKAQAGLEKRLAHKESLEGPLTPEVRATYQERLAYELGVINQMGFPSYFLIVMDFIQWARNHGVMVGPGRGSAAGSLVAYSLEIINVDPIKYDLLFERFLNPERKTMPDVDVDFCRDGRPEVIRYVSETYGGSDRVAQIITIGQMKAKQVLKDVGRVLGIEYAEMDALVKLVPNQLNVTIAQALAAEPKLKALAQNDPRIKSLLDYALLLENLPRHASVHASGVVIGDQPLMEYLPVCCDTKVPEVNGVRSQAITQYDLNEVEENGLVKFDFLGLKTLTLIKHCLALLANKGVNIDLDSLDFKDEETYALLQSGQVNGVFQLESAGIRKVLVRLKPQCLEDISSLLALYRPGPLEGGHVDDFIEIRHGRKTNPSFSPEVDAILKETHGVIVYQEQVMRIAQVLAGYSLGQADILRKAMGKKDEKKMAEMRASFFEGAAQVGTPLDKATSAFDSIQKFARYGFNKSHSLAYAVVTYWTAWLKTHHLPEFMAALLTSEMDKLEKLGRFIEDCRRKGLTVIPPNINVSLYPFSVLNGDIVYGLGAIRGVGQGAVEAIVAARGKGGPFTDLFDFCRRVDSKKLNRKTLEALVMSGAFDQTGIEREVLKEAIPEALKTPKASKKVETGLFDLLVQDTPPVAIKWPEVAPLSQKERLKFEMDYLGVYLSGHPLAPYAPAFKAVSDISIGQAKVSQAPIPVTLAGSLSRVVTKKDKKGRNYAFATLEDMDNSIELLIWHAQLAKVEPFLRPESVVYVEGNLEPGDDKYGTKVQVRDLTLLETALAKKVRTFYIRTLLEDLNQVSDFLTPHLRPKATGDPKVVVGILDPVGEAFYALDKSLELTPAFIAKARDALGLFGEIHCLNSDPSLS